MKIVVIELKKGYEEEVAKVFAKLDLPDVIFVLVPKDANVDIVDVFEVYEV